MSTASLPPGSTANQPHPSDGLIAERIEAVRAALWRSELTRSLLLLVLFIIAILLGWAIIDQWIWSGGPMLRLAAWGATAGLVIVWSMRRIVPLFTSRIDAAYAAHSIERDIPDIKHALSSYVALRDQRDVSGLRGIVVRSIGSRAAGRLKQHEGLLPSEIASSFRLWIMVAVAFAVLAAYTVFSPKDTIHSAGRLILPLSSIDPPTRVRILEVNPGHTEVLAGQEVEVVARIAGLRDADEPQVLWESGSEQRTIPMGIDEERGPSFFRASLGGTYGIETSGHYTVMAGDASSERFEITTSDVPVAHVESVHYQPPAYTKLPERTTRAAAIEGIEGTTVTLVARTNRPITEAQIELNPRTTGGRTTATAGVFPMQIDSEGTKITAQIVLRIGADQPGVVPLSSYRIRIADSDGAKNPEPVVHPIRVLPDLAPEVTIASPVRNPKDVPIDAQQLIEVHALDPDFGLTRIALQMVRGSQRLEDVVLWQNADSEPRNHIALYRFRPQDLGLHPGDVVRIRAVATDNRVHPTKQRPAPNITVSDPIELRLVDAANMNESRPSEDGLSAPDDQPAVEPPKDGESGTKDQQQEKGDSSSAGSGGESGSTEESSSEGESSDGGSPSEGTAEGDQQGSSTGEQDGGGAGEGAGSESDEPSAAGSGDGQENAESGGEEGSETGGASGAASSSDPSSPQAGEGGEAGEQDPSAMPDRGESPMGSDAQASDSTAPGAQEGADSSAADSGASADRQGSQERSSGEQSGDAGAGEGAEAGEARDESSSSPSPPKHDGEAIERMKEYLDEQQKDSRKPSPADQSPDQRNAESEGAGDAGERETPAGAASQDAADRDPSSGEPPMSDPSAAEEGVAPEGDASDRSGQSGDSTDQANVAGDPSTGDSSEEETTSEGESAGDAPETDPAGEASDGDSTGEESETDPSAAPGNTADGTEPDAKASPSEPGDPGADSDDASTPVDAGATPSPQDPASTDAQDRDPSASPADQPSADEQDPTGNGTEQDRGSPPSSAEGSATTGRDGSTDSGEPTSEFVESDETPEPVDMEYAKKATDMVLDYLKETRDRPDQELLDRLNWSEEDMQRFLNRWESARQMEPGNGGDGSQEFEEAIRSLGIRDRSTAGRGAEADRADQLRDLRDSGTRRPAPTLYRDAFEAFRRSVGR